MTLYTMWIFIHISKLSVTVKPKRARSGRRRCSTISNSVRCFTLSAAGDRRYRGERQASCLRACSEGLAMNCASALNLIRACACSRHKSDKRDADLILDLLLGRRSRRAVRSSSGRRSGTLRGVRACGRAAACHIRIELRRRGTRLEAVQPPTQKSPRRASPDLFDDPSKRIERASEASPSRPTTSAWCYCSRKGRRNAEPRWPLCTHFGDVSRFASSKQVVAYAGPRSGRPFERAGKCARARSARPAVLRCASARTGRRSPCGLTRICGLIIRNWRSGARNRSRRSPRRGNR